MILFITTIQSSYHF